MDDGVCMDAIYLTGRVTLHGLVVIVLALVHCWRSISIGL